MAGDERKSEENIGKTNKGSGAKKRAMFILVHCMNANKNDRSSIKSSCLSTI